MQYPLPIFTHLPPNQKPTDWSPHLCTCSGTQSKCMYHQKDMPKIWEVKELQYLKGKDLTAS